MSPILVRPVREQLEHDRLIRLLQTKFRRRFDAGMNPGNEQTAAVGTGPTALYPDLVLSSLDRGRKLQAVVEVETGESVNHLEALAEWAHFARIRAAFHLYVPSAMVDVARQLCDDNHIHVSEIWSYHSVGDEVRFTLVHRSRTEAPAPPRAKAADGEPRKAPAPKAAAKKAAAKPSASTKAPVPAKARAVKKAAPAKAAKPARAVKSAKPAKPVKSGKKPKRK